MNHFSTHDSALGLKKMANNEFRITVSWNDVYDLTNIVYEVVLIGTPNIFTSMDSLLVRDIGV